MCRRLYTAPVGIHSILYIRKYHRLQVPLAFTGMFEGSEGRGCPSSPEAAIQLGTEKTCRTEAESSKLGDAGAEVSDCGAWDSALWHGRHDPRNTSI